MCSRARFRSVAMLLSSPPTWCLPFPLGALALLSSATVPPHLCALTLPPHRTSRAAPRQRPAPDELLQPRPHHHSGQRRRGERPCAQVREEPPKRGAARKPGSAAALAGTERLAQLLSIALQGQPRSGCAQLHSGTHESSACGRSRSSSS